MKYEILFLDLDDTILDFHKAERVALGKTLAHFGLDSTDTVCARYSQINQAHWKMLERGDHPGQVLVGRFEALFREFGLPVDPARCARTYEGFLAVGHYFLPGAEAALEALSRKYRLFLASNGTTHVQAGRLDSAGIRPFFEGIFISQEIGANKPSPLYFERCFAKIPGFDPAKTLIVGDSLSSDILGGRNAGISTCWVNPAHAPKDPAIPADYEIESLAGLEALLETL